MAKIIYESDIDASSIRGSRVGVIGYGSQGRAHALNLRDSGIEVRVALYAGSPSWARAEGEGLAVALVPDVARWADALMFCTPDVPMAGVYASDVAPHLRTGQTLLFAHGFNIHYRRIEPPSFVNVALVAPKGPGLRLRREYIGGGGLPALFAAHQDADGRALAVALGYAWGIGCARAGLIETTFGEETETDLFGEQAVLCGGLVELIKAGFETLVEAGYQPEVAYFECLHETKLIVDLLCEVGLSGMRRSISDTAEWGGYVAGPRVIGAAARQAMKELLAEVRGGKFAQDWIAENEAGRPNLEARHAEERAHPIEQVGERLRRMIGLSPST
jgi:ketol-acid reductoisomerase